MKVRDVIARIEADGWCQVRMRGDHRHYRHAHKPGIVTVAGHPAEDIPAGTLAHIWRQAQIPRGER